MEYNEKTAIAAAQRQRMSKECKGKVIESLEWDDVDKYWVMEFTDGTEMCFRFMAELI